MSKRILVAYATGSGSTREVAAVIGDTLAESGIAIDVQPVQEVESLAEYSGVVVGSSIRLGRWLPDAIDFVADFADALAERPVAYFTTCLSMIDDGEESRQRTMAYMEPVLALAPNVMLADIGLFAGSLDPARRLIMPDTVGPHGDYRDWDAIRAWAASIRSVLAAAELDEAAIQLRAADLQEADLAGADLTAADMTGADLTGADLTGADLQSAALNDADLTTSDLYWTQMADANLQNANLTQGNLIGADLSGADLSGANLGQAILNGSTLVDTVLRGADLSGADLHWANLRGADLRDANLQVAMLGWADLSEADLRGAQLALAMYNEYTRWPEGFSPEDAGCRFVGGVR